MCAGSTSASWLRAASLSSARGACRPPLHPPCGKGHKHARNENFSLVPSVRLTQKHWVPKSPERTLKFLIPAPILVEASGCIRTRSVRIFECSAVILSPSSYVYKISRKNLMASPFRSKCKGPMSTGFAGTLVVLHLFDRQFFEYFSDYQIWNVHPFKARSMFPNPFDATVSIEVVIRDLFIKLDSGHTGQS